MPCPSRTENLDKMDDISCLRTWNLPCHLHMDRGILLIIIRVFLKPHSKGESGYRNIPCSKLLKLCLDKIGNRLLSWSKMFRLFHHLQKFQNLIKDILDPARGMPLFTRQPLLIELETILLYLQPKIVLFTPRESEPDIRLVKVHLHIQFFMGVLFQTL